MLTTQLTNILNNTLKNPIYKTIQLISMTTILKKNNFVKKQEGVSLHLVVLHFVYMLVMNKKISTFMKQSDDAFAKDVYYRLLKNTSYNWRGLLSQSVVKLISMLHVVQDAKAIKVFILDDTVEEKTGNKIEGGHTTLWSNKLKKFVSGINVVSLNYSDGFSNFMLDFAISISTKYSSVAIEDFTNEVSYKSHAGKRRVEAIKGKSQIAIDMIKRALRSGIYADYLLVDSWYSKPIFLKTIQDLGLAVISRMANSNSIWNFMEKEKTLDAIYKKHKGVRNSKMGNYGKIKFTYLSAVVTHKKAGRVKIVFIKTQSKLIPIVSTNIELNDDEIIEIYKRRWDIEQGYKELRSHFGFGQEENRIYEALIARITLSFFTYNVVSYINRISNEPKTIGGLFADLECELSTLAIAMKYFIQILEELAKVEDIVNRNEDLVNIITILRDVTGKMLGFRCES